MVVLNQVEWVNIGLCVSVLKAHGMVGNNIDHYPDVSFVHLSDQRFELLFCPEVVIELVKVFESVSMVSSVAIVWDWRDPDSIVSEVLDVVQVVFDSFPGSPTVISKVIAI